MPPAELLPPSPVVPIDPAVYVAPPVFVEPPVPVDPPSPVPPTGKSSLASRVALLPAQPPEPLQVPPDVPAPPSRLAPPLVVTGAQPAARTQKQRRPPVIRAGRASRKRLAPSRGIEACFVVRCIYELSHTRPEGAFRSVPLPRDHAAPPLAQYRDDDIIRKSESMNMRGRSATVPGCSEHRPSSTSTEMPATSTWLAARPSSLPGPGVHREFERQNARPQRTQRTTCV